ncbi:MAG: murein biosynthesis integral membrane protein MurJ [Chloroflexales bacterium]|nr:murein biosynthesis integral membrane protein MurJ [Chloroflexales bacterium]
MIESSQQSSEQQPSPSAGQPRTRRLRLFWVLHPAQWLTREWSIAEGSLLLMIAFLISAAMGIVRQVLFNAQFGAGLEASAYYAAFRLPDTLANLLAGGTLTNAIVPVILSVARTEGNAGARRLIDLVLTTLLAAVLPIVLLSIVCTPLFVRFLLAPGFDAATGQLTVALTRILLLELLLVVFTGVANAVLISRNQFLLPALSIAATNITLISGIVAARLVPSIGVYGPTVGAVGDAVLQLAILLPGLLRNGFRYRPLWQPRDMHLREVIRLLIPNGLSGVVNYAGGIVDTAFGSLLQVAAVIPAAHNAYLLIGLPIRLLGIAIGQAAFPRIAAYVANEQWDKTRQTFRRTLGIATLLAALTGSAMVVLGRPMIAILFEHGRFDAAAGALTYQLLVAYALALPAYVATEVITRGLIALHDTRTPLLTNCLQLAGRVAIISLLLDSVGVLAIPIAFAITSTIETGLLGIVLWVKLRVVSRN